MAVEPTTSQNSIVTMRRSPCVVRPNSVGFSLRGLPHWRQNRAPSGFSVPQTGQTIAQR